MKVEMKMPGIRMAEGSMTAVEAAYLVTQAKHMGDKVTIAKNPHLPGALEIHIRDSVLHNFKSALNYVRFISDTEHYEIPKSKEDQEAAS